MQNKRQTIELATKVVIEEMGIKLCDKFNTSNTYQQKLQDTIKKTADKYQLKPMTLIRIFK